MVPNYISQLVPNPHLLEGVLIAPYIQQLMYASIDDFDTLRQRIDNNPMMANDPELREQMINEVKLFSLDEKAHLTILMSTELPPHTVFISDNHKRHPSTDLLHLLVLLWPIKT